MVSPARDRATLVAAAVRRIFADALRDGVNDAALDEAEDATAIYLRDEFADTKREAAAERTEGLD